MRGRAIVVAALVTASLAAASAAGARTREPVALRVSAVPVVANLGASRADVRDDGVRSARRLRTLAGARLYGGAVRADTGETVQVFMSDLFVPDASVLRSYANFFAGLIHGPELARLRAFVVTHDEMTSVCSELAAACYSAASQTLILSGEFLPGDVPIEEVAAHEYGHHVAANRNNAPWRAGDWGTKRWASAEGICRRVGAGTAFPGDEGSNYALNSGEAFAESYRVLNDLHAGAAPWPWEIVDQSFYPSQSALDALEQDVRSPWSGPKHYVWKGKLARRGSGSTATLSTPLDGALGVTVHAPAGSTLQVYVGGELVSSTRTGRYAATICGNRSVTTRVVAGRGGSFSAAASVP